MQRVTGDSATAKPRLGIAGRDDAWTNRLFDPEPGRRRVARAIYAEIAELPIVSPHGHVDPALLADPDASLGTPADLLVRHDHYVFRMLHSQGVPLSAIGIPTLVGGPVELDPRRIWQLLADQIELFRGTGTGLWLAYTLREVFGIDEALCAANAAVVYDEIAAKLATPAFRPRALFQRFGIETLCTTDDATDSLAAHATIRGSGWEGDVRPTFRPDGVVRIDAPGWRDRWAVLERTTGREITTTAGLVSALEERRDVFRSMGAVATDHGLERAYTGALEPAAADAILARALRGQADAEEASRFEGNLLLELARMSADDGLVMQLHVGALRNHDEPLFKQFGPDIGADIPVAVELTRNLRPLLERFGNDPGFRLIVFTLDEGVYTRELAPLAGHYPALRAGGPWWFHDSPAGIARYFEAVVESAGLANTVGFNDDARSLCAIPARHDAWRRAAASWLGGLVTRGIVGRRDAVEMASGMADGLARRAYRLDSPAGRGVPA